MCYNEMYKYDKTRIYCLKSKSDNIVCRKQIISVYVIMYTCIIILLCENCKRNIFLCCV